MLFRILAGSGLGVALGALLGYFGKCNSGACPLTANPWRGAFFGLLLGLTFAFSFSPSRAGTGAVAAEKVKALTTTDTFRAEVEKAEGLVFVEFYAPWCGWCRKVQPIVEKLAGEYQGKVKFVKLNTDEVPKVAKKYGVGGLPTMMVFKAGKPQETIVGYRKSEDLRAILDRLLGAPTPKQATASVHEISDATDFDSRVRKAKGVVLVKFHADWCGWCRRMAPVVEKVAGEYAARLSIVGVNTDKHPKLSREFKVKGLPTSVIFKKGKPVSRIVGYRDEKGLKSALDAHLPKVVPKKPVAAGVHELARGSEFAKRVTGTRGLVFVKFHAPWCGWCRRLAPVVKKLATDYAGKVSFVAVDTDRHSKLGKRHGVEGLPTVVLFKDGKQVQRIVGYRKEKALKEILDKHLTGTD